MYKFDDTFLEAVGLGALPEDQKAAFLENAQDQFEVRVGEKMNAQMTDDQVAEFEKIIDNDEETINRWLSNLGDYRSDEIYQRIASRVENESDRVNNYVSAKWLDQNCPNYRQLIEQTLEELKQEIIANKAAILGGQA
jgi:succinate dehydrogenase flavin-adding protein (antitoxin of CptAB toxin-antitoxin module)